MHTVFRVGDIIKISKKKSLYQVNLKLTADDDQQLRTLTDRIREEVVGETGWKRLRQLLIKLSQFDKAEELYNVLLEQTSDKIDKAFYYNQLGYIKGNQGDYEKAIVYYEKGYENWQTDPCNQPSLATFYNNIGAMYNKNGEYPKAVSFYEKALEIYQKTLPVYHPDFAYFYNISSVYSNKKEYSKALSSYQNARKNFEISLPSNHPNIQTVQKNIEYISQENYNLMFNNVIVTYLYLYLLFLFQKTVLFLKYIFSFLIMPNLKKNTD